MKALIQLRDGRLMLPGGDADVSCDRKEGKTVVVDGTRFQLMGIVRQENSPERWVLQHESPAWDWNCFAMQNGWRLCVSGEAEEKISTNTPSRNAVPKSNPRVPFNRLS